LDRGIKKEDKRKYIIINEKEAINIKRFVKSFYILGVFFCVAMGKGAATSLFESYYEHIFWFWALLGVLVLVLIHYYFRKFYDNLFSTHQVISD